MQRTVVTRAVGEVSFYGAVAFFFILAAFPFYWMLITAFKTNPDLYNITNVPFWFNEPPTLEHFRYLFEETLFVRWLLNSLVIGVCGLNVDPYAEDPRIGRVRHLYVLALHRRAGVGEQLVADIIETARSHFARLHLRTTSGPASRLYEELGFRPAPGASHCSHALDLEDPA